MSGNSIPAPTGLRPLGEATANEIQGTLYIEFDATQSEVKTDEIFMSTGGQLADASARGFTDFALSGSEEAVNVMLSDRYLTVVRLPLGKGIATATPGKANMIDLCHRSKLLACTSCEGAAINGSVVSSISGQGAEYLANVCRHASTGHAAIPLCYGDWKAHTAVISMSNMRIVGESGKRYSINFVDRGKGTELAKAEKLVGEYANEAWKRRTDGNGLKYAASPTLTKAVAKQPAGVNASGYVLVHDAIDMKLPYSHATLESMLKNAIELEHGCDPEEIEKFKEKTKMPGRKAAECARSLASGLSMLAATLVNYRADGRTVITPSGCKAVAAESWLRMAPRSVNESNDCDGSAILIKSICSSIFAAPANVLETHTYMNACRNILTHYTIGVSVLGACAGEASDLDGTRHKQIAGHAAAMMVPTMSLLIALEKGAEGKVCDEAVVSAADRSKLASARFEAVFNAETLAGMTLSEQACHETYELAKSEYEKQPLEVLVAEGTTPASASICVSGERLAKARTNAHLDAKAFTKVGSTIGRSIKILYAGGRHEGHQFYSDFVEFNVDRHSPLWTDPTVRGLGHAATQFVFAQPPSRAHAHNITVAGATPEQLASGTFAAVPLVPVAGHTAAALDVGSAMAERRLRAGEWP